MTVKRTVSSAFLFAVFVAVIGACGAAVMPPPNYISTDKTCSNDLQCRNFKLPACTRNENMCYRGKCLVTPISPCPSPTVTATAGPVPTLSPTIDPAPTAAPPATPAAPN